MPNEVVGAEDVVVSRVKDKLEVVAPGFDPAIITTMIGLLTDLFAGCMNGNTTQLTPQEAVDKVSKMTPFQKSMLQSRLKRKAREDGVKDASHLAPIAAKAVVEVAKEATPEEQLAFAAHVLPIANSDFTMI